MEGRVKTDLRFPPELLDKIDEVCAALGIPKNAFFVMAASLLTLQLAPLVRVKQRKQLILHVQDLFQKLISDIANTL
jgi:hypothetical protein